MYFLGIFLLQTEKVCNMLCMLTLHNTYVKLKEIVTWFLHYKTELKHGVCIYIELFLIYL